MIECRFIKTVFEDKESGYCVVVYLTSDAKVPKEARNNETKENFTFTAVGNYLPKNKSGTFKLYGAWTASKFGLQLTVENYTEELPKSNSGIISYLSSGLIKNIGYPTAKAIVDEFGSETFNVIEQNPQKLLTIKGITESKLNEMLTSYNQNMMLKEIVTFLSPFGISVNQISKIYNTFKSETMNILKSNPFKLSEISGFGFKTVDSIARKVNLNPKDSLRIEGAVLYALAEGLTEGHLFLEYDNLLNKSHTLLNDDFKVEMVKKTEIESAVSRLSKSHKIFLDYKNVYSYRAYISEANAAEELVSILNSKQKKMSFNWPQLLKDIKENLKIDLSPEQIQAVKMSLVNKVLVITGGPGTGKTTTINSILYAYKKVHKNPKIIMLAPTGRAARKMTEATGYEESYTIHSALGLKGEESFPECLEIEEDLVIVDESSMLDMRISELLFTYISKDANLILVGDADQLPSVGAGNVFREIINSGIIPVVRLKMVFRHSDKGTIALNAHSINNGETHLNYGDDFLFIETESDAETLKKIIQITKAELSDKSIDEVQILSPFRKKGLCSVNNINNIIQELLNPPSNGKPELKVGKKILRICDKVMQTKNIENASNGDIGYITGISKDEDGKVILTVKFGEKRFVSYTSDKISQLNLSYASTIHKSQGDEYQTVIIPMLSSFYIMLKRNLIYTAVTRAKCKIILVGQKKALYTAISRNDVDKRNTLYGYRLKRSHLKHLNKNKIV